MINMKSWDQKWNQQFEATNGNQYPESHVIRFVARNFYSVDQKKNLKILDLGCGTGVYCWYLAREGFSPYGIDGSSIAIKKAEKRLTQDGLKAEFTVSDITEIPYPDNFFDGVIDGTAIQHNKISKINIIIGEVFRVLKQGGAFFSMMISHEEPQNSDLYTHYFTKKEICDLLKKHNFLNIKIGYYEYNQFSLNNIEYKYFLIECNKK